MRIKIVDMSINQEGDWWRLVIPIKIGSISVSVRQGVDKELDEFLNNAFKLPSRRFGETPTND